MFAIAHFLNILCVPFWSDLRVIKIYQENALKSLLEVFIYIEKVLIKLSSVEELRGNLG